MSPQHLLFMLVCQHPTSQLKPSLPTPFPHFPNYLKNPLKPNNAQNNQFQNHPPSSYKPPKILFPLSTSLAPTLHRFATGSAEQHSNANYHPASPHLLMIIASIRRIFASFRTEEEERSYSRSAFFNLLGFLGLCVMFSFVAQKLLKQA